MAKKIGTAQADTLIGTAKADELYGDGGNDILKGNGGNDYLDGGTGDDDLRGGAGNDIYIVDNAGDIDKKLADPGFDKVGSHINYTLGPNQEVLVLLDKSALNGTGNNLSNELFGNDGVNILSGLGGNDYLDGHKGIDDLRGGAGDDIYVIDSIKEINKTLADPGNDRVQSVVTYVLGDHQEQLFLSGKAAISGTGNNGDNTLAGNDAANTLRGLDGIDIIDGGKGNDLLFGGAGNDQVFGGDGNDTLNGGSGDDQLFGNAGNDILNGDDGNDTLQGDSGHDVLKGGAGDDVYVLDGSTVNGVAKDTAADIATGTDPGNDTVVVNFNFALEPTSGQENITLYGNLALRAQGNDESNILRAITTLSGDELLGLGGNDFLDGGDGDDHLVGGDGNDTYRVDNLGDIDEADVDAGIDTVESTITYTLLANQENLTLRTSATLLDGSGNVKDNVIRGNDGANVLHGLGGNDELIGGGGADSLFGDDGNDLLHYNPQAVVIDGGAGATDTLFLSGAAATITLDLTAIADDVIKDIEVIQFAPTSFAPAQAHDLTLNASDVLALSSTTNFLQIFGEADDTVHLVGGGWQDQGVFLTDFQRYTNGSADVLVGLNTTSHALDVHVILT